MFVERVGRIARVEARFHDDAHLLHVIDRILSPLGRRVDEASPMVDARLPDGSRVNVVIPPLAIDGPALTIRRFSAQALTCEDLVALGTLDADTVELLDAGGAGAAQPARLGGNGQRQDHHARRPLGLHPGRRAGRDHRGRRGAADPPAPRGAAGEQAAVPGGGGAVPIRALVRNALRMRPDRIVVGEVRGGEALDMLTAMTTGHEGSLSTLHASSPGDAIRRVQTMALMGDLDLPYRAVSEQVASALDLIVHQARLPDGSRRVVEVAAVASGTDGRA